MQGCCFPGWPSGRSCDLLLAADFVSIRADDALVRDVVNGRYVSIDPWPITALLD